MIKTICVASPDELRRNYENAAGLGLPWLAALPEDRRSLAIVGGGHSTKAHLDEILSWPGPVMAINKCYDWLASKGRIADYVITLDPQPHVASFFSNPSQSTRFYVADCCHPEVFDALSKSDVVLFHAPQGDETEGDVPGGPSAMTRAPVLAAILGFRDVTIFGADGCIIGAQTHVEGGEIPPETFRVHGWETTFGLFAQTQYMADLIPAIGEFIKVKLVGNHLASDMLKAKA